ncbi:MAG TPA: hypothetical protein VFQ65_10925 [Kofleriaceae bacterium]|nr:hypothetical protein [Kofleriaceae bacterium]
MKLAWLALWVGLAGCGRIDFDPALPPNDGRLPGDGTSSHGDGATAIDAPVSACVAAMPMQVQVGVLAHVSTCTDPDRLDGCGPAGTKEVILELIPPASTGYTARAYDHGTTNVTMVSTTVFDQTCQPSVGACAAILGTTYTQGVPVYFVLEASNGGCADIDFLVD